MKFFGHDGLHPVLGQLVLLDPKYDFLALKKNMIKFGKTN